MSGAKRWVRSCCDKLIRQSPNLLPATQHPKRTRKHATPPHPLTPQRPARYAPIFGKRRYRPDQERAHSSFEEQVEAMGELIQVRGAAGLRGCLVVVGGEGAQAEGHRHSSPLQRIPATMPSNPPCQHATPPPSAVTASHIVFFPGSG